MNHRSAVVCRTSAVETPLWPVRKGVGPLFFGAVITTFYNPTAFFRC